MPQAIKGHWVRVKNNLVEKGLIITTGKILMRTLISPIADYSSYLINEGRYPQKIIFIAGYARSGSTWISNLFGSLKGFSIKTPSRWWLTVPDRNDTHSTDLYPGIFDEFRRNLAVIKGHTWASSQNIEVLKDSGLKYFITVRDPRDKIISEYWYIRNHPNHWEHMDVLSKTLSEYITYKLDSGEFAKENLEWIRLWLDSRNSASSLILRYEDFVKDTYRNFKIALNLLDFNLPAELITSIIEKNTFTKLTGRIPGQEDVGSFIRKGSPGEWKQIFSDEQKKSFTSCGEDVIETLDYEPTMA